MMKPNEVAEWVVDEISDLTDSLGIFQDAEIICNQKGLSHYLVDVTVVVKKQDDGNDGFIRFDAHIDNVTLRATHNFFFADENELGIITTRTKDKPIIPHLSASEQVDVCIDKDGCEDEDDDIISLEETISSMEHKLLKLEGKEEKELFNQIVVWLKELRDSRLILGYIQNFSSLYINGCAEDEGDEDDEDGSDI